MPTNAPVALLVRSKTAFSLGDNSGWYFVVKGDEITQEDIDFSGMSLNWYFCMEREMFLY